MTDTSYDVIIVGAGPSGIFTAYEIREHNPSLKILLIEKGHSIEKRKCHKRKTGICANCNPCNITTGFSGGGSFSDGKLSINEDGEIGGDLVQYIGLEKFRKVLHYTDALYVGFGADPTVYGVEKSPMVDAIHRNAAQAHMKLIDSGVRHMGTEKAYEIYSRIQKELEKRNIEMLFDSPVKDFIIDEKPDGEKWVRGVITFDDRQYTADHVVVGIGREGSEWLNGICGNMVFIQKLARWISAAASKRMLPSRRGLTILCMKPNWCITLQLLKTECVPFAGIHAVRWRKKSMARRWQPSTGTVTKMKPIKRAIPILPCWSPRTLLSRLKRPLNTGVILPKWGICFQVTR
jgi:hypothetical protein